jgi:hypothetical protein
MNYYLLISMCFLNWCCYLYLPFSYIDSNSYSKQYYIWPHPNLVLQRKVRRDREDPTMVNELGEREIMGSHMCALDPAKIELACSNVSLAPHKSMHWSNPDESLHPVPSASFAPCMRCVVHQRGQCPCAMARSRSGWGHPCTPKEIAQHLWAQDLASKSRL